MTVSGDLQKVRERVKSIAKSGGGGSRRTQKAFAKGLGGSVSDVVRNSEKAVCPGQ